MMEQHGVDVRSIRVLRGPNIHAHMPVLQIELDIGSYEERPSTAFPGFAERIAAWLPGLDTHECSVGRPGGFIQRLQRGTYLAHIVEHVTLELQTLIGFDVAFGRARGTGERGVYRVVVAYEEAEPARQAFAVALRLTLAALHDEPFNVPTELEALRDIADRYRLGPSTAAIVAAARRRDIPILRVTPTTSLVQLGYGVYQKRIQASETCQTSAIAVDMCQDKALTNQMLRAVGVPVPEGRTITSAGDAWDVAQEIGLPVVVKPADGNQGKGVSVDLRAEDEIRAAVVIAQTYGREVLIERAIAGDDYRLLVVNGELVAAARRDGAQVIGDGRHTVRELVEIVNADPRRRPGHSGSLSRIALDGAAELVLHQQQMTIDSVPAPAQIVKLRSNCNLSTGGTAVDVTDQVHPANERMARLAAQIMGLDIAGIDMLCRDIRRPLGEQGGAIIEVNAAPGLRMHLHPAEGQSRDVGRPVIDMLYPANAPARIPIIAVTGTNGKTTVTRLISHIYETAHRVVGMTCTEGTYIARERIIEGDCSGPRSAQAVLLHPRVEVAVLETARGGILREGLAFDGCSVGVVTNLSADHLGIGGINTVEELARVKQVVVEAVRHDGAAVLNADDPLVAEMAAATDAEIVYFSLSPQQHIVAAHVEGGGRAVVVEDGAIMLIQERRRIGLVELDRVGFTLGGTIRFQVLNALAAAAACWAAGLNPALIARALSTFTTDGATVPGRFNLHQISGVELIVDYGHNVAAIEALGEAIAALSRRRTVLAIALPGDRRDEDLVATIAATIRFADEYVLYELGDRRGRAEGDLIRLLRERLPADAASHVAADQRAALHSAWQLVQPGDRLVLIVDLVDDALRLVHSLTDAIGADAACTAPISLELGA